MVMNHHCMRKITYQSFQSITNELFERLIMTQTEGLCRNQISNQQFLFSKTTPIVKSDQPDPSEFISIQAVKEKFPKILIENTFLDAAMAHVVNSKRFSTMVIRIDDISFVINPDNMMADLAEAIDGICREQSGVWGLFNHYLVGCVFTETTQKSCLKIAEQLMRTLAELRMETVSIGIAVYPTISYKKNDIFENAKKALDHAEFFGVNSCVAFDSVSLNISGDKYYQAGDIDKAIDEFLLALELDKDNVNVHNSLGVCYGIKGDMDKALNEFETAAGLDPKEIMPVYNAGYVHFLNKKYATALDYFLKAEQIDDTVFELAVQTGRIYLELNQIKTAKKYLENAIALNRKSAVAYRLLGDAYTLLDQISDAITAYKTSLKINPDGAHSLSSLGYLYEIKKKNADIALMFCRQSTQLDPHNGLFRQRLGQLYLNRKQIQKALDEFQQAKELGHKSDEYIAKALKLMSSQKAGS